MVAALHERPVGPLLEFCRAWPLPEAGFDDIPHQEVIFGLY